MAKRKFDLTSEKTAHVIDPENGNVIGRKSSVPIICERIRFYREREHIEQKSLAAALGVTANSVSNWENGRSRPDVNLLPDVCKALGITLYDIFGMNDPAVVNTEPQKQLLDGYSQLSAGHRHAVDEMIRTLRKIELAENCPKLRVLLYFSRALAAGTGDPTEFVQDAEPVYVYETPEVSRANSIFRVNGDSMEPEFHNGQDVLVKRITDGNQLNEGDTGAFIVGNETYIKQYRRDGLHSLNPEYPVMHFSECETVYLIGRVVGILPSDGYAKQEDIDSYRLLHPETEVL